jgi:hypothetical protein
METSSVTIPAVKATKKAAEKDKYGAPFEAIKSIRRRKYR